MSQWTSSSHKLQRGGGGAAIALGAVYSPPLQLLDLFIGGGAGLTGLTIIFHYIFQMSPFTDHATTTTTTMGSDCPDTIMLMYIDDLQFIQVHVLYSLHHHPPTYICLMVVPLHVPGLCV